MRAMIQSTTEGVARWKEHVLFGCSRRTPPPPWLRCCAPTTIRLMAERDQSTRERMLNLAFHDCRFNLQTIQLNKGRTLHFIVGESVRSYTSMSIEFEKHSG
jgi:hypothetical protein